jgi:hypothetical protein
MVKMLLGIALLALVRGYFNLTFRMIDLVPNIRSLQGHKDWSWGGIDR